MGWDSFWCVLSEPVVSGKPGPSTSKRCLGWCFVDFHGLNGSAIVNSNWSRVSDEPVLSNVCLPVTSSANSSIPMSASQSYNLPLY